MLHAVKYLLIAMQFPQVHKELYDDDVHFVYVRDDLNWIINENFLTISTSKAKLQLFFHPPLKIYNLQLNFKPCWGTLQPFQLKAAIQFLLFRGEFSNFPSREQKKWRKHLKTLCARLHTKWDYSPLWVISGEFYLWIINQIIVLWVLSLEWVEKFDECVQIESINVMRLKLDCRRERKITTSLSLAFSIGTRYLQFTLQMTLSG